MVFWISSTISLVKLVIGIHTYQTTKPISLSLLYIRFTSLASTKLKAKQESYHMWNLDHYIPAIWKEENHINISSVNISARWDFSSAPNENLQSGHVLWWPLSHLFTQILWNLWEQGRTRISSLAFNLDKHTQHQQSSLKLDAAADSDGCWLLLLWRRIM